MLRILLINEKPQFSTEIRQALLGGAYLLLELSASVAVVEEAAKWQADLIIIDCFSPSQALLQQLNLIDKAKLMFASSKDKKVISHIIKINVNNYVINGAEELTAQMAIAIAHYTQNKELQQRIALLEQQLADRKIIDKAKGLLMVKRQLSEADAYDTLRRQAMKQGLKLGEVARQILLMADVLG
ncbi:ANTAR domain-containing response regulator [Iodobacter sp.]|uniref:ANTAR domain-containing response regulator n=1 Tax=Iodobacter sp. TaxID=1915058 RepID=UPI0025CBEEB6|nr:ANTAR domain-containing protein [Iodobacter sp.]